MVRKISKNLDDIRDSRLQYEKTLPPFGYAIILVVMGLLIAVLIWSLTAHKSYIVKGSGTVVSDNKNYIMSDYTGEISKINMTEGAYVQEGDTLFVIKSTDLKLQKQQLEGKIKNYQKKVNKYELLEKSVKDDKNYLSATSAEDRIYYNMYEDYKSKVAENQIDVSIYKNNGYTKAQIAAEIKKNEEKINEVYYETLQTISNAVGEANDQINDLNVQLKAVNNGESDYVIKADASGVVHLSANYKKGMVVQAGNNIGSIANEKDKYYISSYINASDMPLIKEGSKVNIAVSGLNENMYGTLSGKVVQIDSDITTNENSGKSYFKIKVEPQEGYLVSKSGNKVNISNGMVVETRVTYDEITYFRYVLESLGLLVR